MKPKGSLRRFALAILGASTALLAGYAATNVNTPPAAGAKAMNNRSDEPTGSGGVDLSVLSLEFNSREDRELHARLVAIDEALRARYDMAPEDTAAGVLDLRTGRLAFVRPDAITYAASVPKIAILLAWFHEHAGDPAALDPVTRHELGEMIKRSNNELASKFSRPIGIARIQSLLDAKGFYDPAHGGGLWFGKHYGQDSERVRDPVGGHTHAATARQLVRFYLLLEQGRLGSPEASQQMREIFASPEIPHLDDRFVKALAGRGVQLRRKSGWWETWSHDTAVITGPGRYYILVGLTHHPRGTEYLEGLAQRVDDVLAGRSVD